MQTIWKFPIRLDVNLTVDMPKGSLVLSAGVQDGSIMVWALVQDDAEQIRRRFAVYGTGHPMLPKDAALLFVGTVFMGSYVWHVFDGGEAAE